MSLILNHHTKPKTMYTLPTDYMSAFLTRAAKLDKRRQVRRAFTVKLPDSGYWYERPSDYDDNEY